MSSPSNGVAAVVVAAMAEELAPYLEQAGSVAATHRLGHADVHEVSLLGTEVLLVRSGIGLVNAAAATGAVLATRRPAAVVSTGSAGGTSTRVGIGSVAVGDSYAYTGVDASAFGYESGQVPGMPPRFSGDEDLVHRAAALEGVVVGRIVSGDTFVDGERLAPIRRAHPEAIATDMESTAIAQVAYAFTVPFVSVRGISDMCGPLAADEHPATVGSVSTRACEVVLALLGVRTAGAR